MSERFSLGDKVFIEAEVLSDNVKDPTSVGGKFKNRLIAVCIDGLGVNSKKHVCAFRLTLLEKPTACVRQLPLFTCPSCGTEKPISAFSVGEREKLLGTLEVSSGHGTFDSTDFTVNELWVLYGRLLELGLTLGEFLEGVNE